MNYVLSSDYYKNELERIDRDNSVEQALYFIIQLLLRSRLSEEYWITDTSLRSREDVGESKSVPDLMIFDEEHGINKEECPDALALVEVKYFPWRRENRLENNRDQVEGYLEKNNRVIYTNGIEWIFLYGKNNSIEKEVVICLGNEDSKPESYYEIIDKNSLKSQIKWKKAEDFSKAWEELMNELERFIDKTRC